MALIFSSAIFIFGLIIGSFLNVVIYRYGTGYTLGGRSGCLICGRELRWFELVPLFSFALQLGRCRTCSSRISWQYPLVELATALLFLASFWRYGLVFNPMMIVDWLILSLLLVIAVYDGRHKIIPDPFVYGFVVIALLQAVWRGQPTPAVVTGLALFAFFWLLWFASRGRWLGFGDAKLVLGFGFFLGPAALSAVIIAFWLGAAVGLALIGLKGYKMKSEVPFAPFLIIGAALVYLFNFDVISLVSFL